MRRFLRAAASSPLVLALLLAACEAPEAPAAAESSADVSSVPGLAVTTAGVALTSSVVARGDARRLVLTHADGRQVEVARGAVSDHSQAAPRIAVLPGGAVLVLYVVTVPVDGRRFPASDVLVVRSSDGGQTFGAPVRVNPASDVPTDHTFADLAVGADGSVVVSWLDGGASDRWKAAQPAGTESASHGGADAHHAVPIRLVHAGESHAAPAGGDPGTTLVVARSEDGGRTFTAPVSVAGGTCPCCRTALDAGPDGAVRVAWRHVWPGGERDAAIATSRDGGRTFGAPVRVHADRWAIDGCPHTGPAVAAGSDGRVHVAWYTGAPRRLGLWHAVSRDGGATFAAPTALAAGAPLGQVRAARDGSGAVWLAWEDRSTARVRLARASGGDTTTVAGVDPALVGTARGVTLATVVDGAVRIQSR